VLSVTIETAVFAPPPIDASTEVVRSFVETLLEWKEAMDDERLDVYTSGFAADVLINCNLYPIRPQLKALLAQSAVFEYDANTVAVLAETILNRSSKIEDKLGISDILVSELALNPDVFAHYTPSQLLDDAQRCVIVLSLANRFVNEPMLRGHAIAIRTTNLATAVQVKCIIQDIEHTRGDLGELPLAPDHFEGSILVCSSSHHLLMSVSEVEMLRSATDERHLTAAIRVGLYKRYVSSGQPVRWQDLPTFFFGHDFIASLTRHHVTSGSGLAERLMRALVETISHDKLDATHALRSGQGAGDTQRTRGSDLAWRRDIDRDFHLHYWERDTGFVELAALVVHNDFSIS
jgi:hypothetical protein